MVSENPSWNGGVGGARAVLLHDVHESVYYAVRNLPVGEGEGESGVEHREHGEYEVARKGELFGGRPAADDGVRVHFRACRGDCEHRSQRERLFDVASVRRQNAPRIFALERHGGCDEFACVYHASAAESQHEVEPVFTRNFDRFEACFVFGVRLYSRKFHDFPLAESRDRLVVRAVFLDASAAVYEKHPRLCGNELRQFRSFADSENEFGGIV